MHFLMSLFVTYGRIENLETAIVVIINFILSVSLVDFLISHVTIRLINQ